MQNPDRGFITYRILTRFLLACFLLSGAIALVYQTLWVRMFTISFGSTTHAVSTVLCAFMAGLSLGSWFFGKVIDKSRRKSILIYGTLELGIAASALVIPHALRVTDQLHIALYDYLLGSNLTLNLVKFLLAFLVLIIPTTLMGGTLPVLVRFFVRRNDEVGCNVGTLYGANTFGAVVGCLLTGFYLIGMLGVSNTMNYTVLVNAGVGLLSLALYYLSRNASGSERGADDDAPIAETSPRELPDESVGLTSHIVLWFAAFAGMTALAYEVFWTRVLVFYMNNSVYAFSSMLTTMLLGLAVGAYLFGKIADGKRNLWLWFAGFEFAIGLWAIFAFPALDVLFHRLAADSKLFEANFWGVPLYVKAAKSAMLMLVPTLLMGAAFPLLGKLHARNINRVGTSIGNIYSKNTVGSMVGAFCAGFILIPLFGIQKGVIAVATLNIGLALAAVWMSGIRLSSRRILMTMLLTASVASVIVAPKHLFFRRHDEQWNKLLFYKEDNTATVKVYERPGGKRVISINGYEVAGAYVSLHEIQKALGHYPALLHRNPKSALIIGFGAGGTSWSISRYGLERIDLVEIVPSVLEAAPYLEEVNHHVLSTPNFHVTIDDGRNYVHATKKRYDIITVDSVDPKHAGNGNLYTVEFYRDCLSKLTQGGIMAEWIPYHLLSEEELKIILKSFSTAFPHSQLWFTPFYRYFILVGSPDEIVLDYGRLAESFRNPQLAVDLKLCGAISPAAFVTTFAMDDKAIARYVADTEKVNTYDRPCIEFFGDYDYGTFGQLPITEPQGNLVLVNMGKTEAQGAAAQQAVKRYEATAREMIKGHYYFTRNDYSEAAMHWRRALALDEGNTSANYMLTVLDRIVKRELDKRIAHLTRNPKDYQACFEMGAFCEKIRSPQSAIQMYAKAIELKPDFEAAYNNLGMLYGKYGQYDRAITTLKAALKVNPASVVAAYNAGIVYYMKGDYQKAEDMCRKALSYPATKDDALLRKKIGSILRQIGRASVQPTTKTS